jgi:hypothetical protein
MEKKEGGARGGGGGYRLVPQALRSLAAGAMNSILKTAEALFVKKKRRGKGSWGRCVRRPKRRRANAVLRMPWMTTCDAGAKTPLPWTTTLSGAVA